MLGHAMAPATELRSAPARASRPQFSIFLPPLQILQPYPIVQFDAMRAPIRGRSRMH